MKRLVVPCALSLFGSLACATVQRSFGDDEAATVSGEEPEAEPEIDASAPRDGTGGDTATGGDGAAGGSSSSPAAGGAPGSAGGEPTPAGGSGGSEAADLGGFAGTGTGGTGPSPSSGGASASQSGGSGAPVVPAGGANAMGGEAGGQSNAGNSSGGGPASGGMGPGGAGGVGVAGSPNAGAGNAAAGGPSGSAGDSGGAGGTPGTGNCAPEILASCGVDCSTVMGSELVIVPGGSLAIGSDDLPNTSPPVSVDFDAFCMDRTEVTVAQYRECVDDGTCVAPDTTISSECSFGRTDQEDHPVTCLGRDEALTYCDWAGKRLPNEREWEYAARGSEGRLYPWGDQAPDADRLNWNSIMGTTTSVGAFAAGATLDTQIYDMSGNVWEWVDSEWCESHEPGAACTPGLYVAKGGSYISSLPEHVRPSWRDNVNAGDQRFGFRCAAGAGER